MPCLIGVADPDSSGQTGPTAAAVLRFTPLGETLKKLFSPTLEKALTFLDDKLLPSTSNAVERGNRRYRKMQKQVYRVRTQAQVSARLALDMWREPKGQGATKPSTPYMRHVLPKATRYPRYSLSERVVLCEKGGVVKNGRILC